MFAARRSPVLGAGLDRSPVARRPRPSPSGPWLPPVAIAVIAVILIGSGSALAFHPADLPSKRAAGTPRTVTYSSSVDRFPLSYLEWLPPGFVARNPLPLLVYLHGMGSGTTAVRGGTGATSIPSTFISAASTQGVLLISINTRTDSGFFANTPCGGPQGQDVLDAIGHEKVLRNVSSVYLIGFSMGSAGALSLAATHPGLARGIALEGTITDLFEVSQFLGAIPQLRYDFCNVVPSASAPSVVAAYAALSPLRFHPQNFSAIKVYVTAGGKDTRAPNNFSLWPFSQVNSTVVNVSTLRYAAGGEPVPSNVTLSSLHRSTPSAYAFRFVYEAAAGHSAIQINAADLMSFFFGSAASGLFVAGFPPTTIVPAP